MHKSLTAKLQTVINCHNNQMFVGFQNVSMSSIILYTIHKHAHISTHATEKPPNTYCTVHSVYNSNQMGTMGDFWCLLERKRETSCIFPLAALMIVNCSGRFLCGSSFESFLSCLWRGDEETEEKKEQCHSNKISGGTSRSKSQNIYQDGAIMSEQSRKINQEASCQTTTVVSSQKKPNQVNLEEWKWDEKHYPTEVITLYITNKVNKH